MSAGAEIAMPKNGRVEPSRTHILTVSLEEYFQGGALADVVLRKHWDRFEPRLDRSVDRVLKTLDEHRAQATFFVLGMLADRNPALVRRIVGAGHEVASRGYWPRGIAGMQVEEFEQDLDRTAAAILAAGGQVRGFRSPRWLRHEDLWILESLAKKGYAYDASVNPIGRRFARAPHFHVLQRHAIPGVEGGILEVPVSTASWAGLRVPIGGGNWMRQLPFSMLARAVAKWDRERTDPLVFYVTSWEFDPEQPMVTAASALNRLRQYRNLHEVHERLQRYLLQYRFTSIADHVQRVQGQALRQPVSPPPRQPEPIVVDSRPASPAAARQAVSLVVPMYQEEENVGYLLRTIDTVRERLAATHTIELVCVDDCSRDKTYDTLRDACHGRDGVKIVRHDQNRGVAAAIQTGIRAASHEVVCSIDCDCSYDPMELGRMIARLDGADMVTASPYHPDGQVLNVPRWRLFLSRTLSWTYRRILHRPIYTWTSCFRVYRRSKVVDLELQHGGFLGIAELLVRVLRRGGVVHEYPTLLESRLLGASKMKTLRTVRGHLGLLWQVGSGKIR